MSKPTLAIGAMRHRISIEGVGSEDDGIGGKTHEWSTLCSVWAEVLPVSGNEFYYAHQLKNAITHKIKIRYRTDITVAMRVVFEGRIMKIESLINLLENGKFLQLRCVEEIVK